jgi:hypothetical protein
MKQFGTGVRRKEAEICRTRKRIEKIEKRRSPSDSGDRIIDGSSIREVTKRPATSFEMQ